jgi:hypothetical protein
MESEIILFLSFPILPLSSCLFSLYPIYPSLSTQASQVDLRLFPNQECLALSCTWVHDNLQILQF